ncbi:MAG: LysR family transcriptional regulator [Dehalococcoidia bacterium]
MDFRLIEAFVAVARHGTLTKAAEELYLAQPSVTARIQALELELGQTLLHRSRRGVVLTEAGTRFLRHAERVLREIDESRQELADLRAGRRGRLVLGAAPAISTYFLPPMLVRFAHANPEVELAIRTGHSEDILRMVLDDTVHLGLVRRVVHPAIDSYPVAYEELVLVAAPSHRFAAEREISIVDLASEGLILFDRTSRWHELTWALFASQGVTPHVRLETDNVETAKRMIEVGLGVALLPRVAVEREIAFGSLTSVVVSDAPPVRREVLAVRRRDAALSWPVQSFLMLLPGRGQDLLPQTTRDSA